MHQIGVRLLFCAELEMFAVYVCLAAEIIKTENGGLPPKCKGKRGAAMKRACTMLAAITMLLVVSIGCGKTEDRNMTLDATLDEVVQGVRESLDAAYVRMPVELDDAALTELLGLTADDVDEYAGHYSMTMSSADCFIAVKASEGREDAVHAALERRRAEVVRMFEDYLPQPLEVAKAGRVLEKGRYVFLVMLGGPDGDTARGVQQVEAVINSYFEQQT